MVRIVVYILLKGIRQRFFKFEGRKSSLQKDTNYVQDLNESSFEVMLQLKQKESGVSWRSKDTGYALFSQLSEEAESPGEMRQDKQKAS